MDGVAHEFSVSNLGEDTDCVDLTDTESPIGGG
jgi:hypothetical protein